MKLKLLIVVPLLALAVHTPYCQNIAQGALAKMNVERVHRGLEIVNYSPALATVAKMYAIDMAVKQELSHSIMTWSERFRLIREEINRNKETWLAGRGIATVRECLAYLPKGFNDHHFGALIYRIGHVFDDSPSHAVAVYHERAIVAGWGVITERTGYWICLYVVTEKE